MDTEALRKSLFAKFRDVTTDRLEKIGVALLALERDPSAAAPGDEAARELHTMKGEARMLGLPRIAELAHGCEDMLKAGRERRAPRAAVTDLLLQACDRIGDLLDDLPRAEGPDEGVRAFCERLAQAAAAPAAEPAPPPHPAAAPPSPAAGAGGAAEPVPETGSGSTEAASRSVRVEVDALERIAALAGDLLVEGGRSHLRGRGLAELVGRINRLGDRFLALASLVSQLLPQEARHVDQLETDLHLLRDDIFRFTRRSADGIDLLRGMLSRLAEEVAEARLVPLSTVFAAFPRAVRDIARGQQKQVELRIAEIDIGVDGAVLGEVRDALVHLLRNAVDHGIEEPAARSACGKPAAGRVDVEVLAHGDLLEIAVRDDGRGIDPAAVRAAAVARSLLSAAQAAALSDREVLELVFAPGFSTRETVTDLSGRGVGMSVVKKKVEGLGGSVAIASQPGAWTRVVLRVPQTLALMRVLLVRVGGEVYGVPAAHIEAVGRVRFAERVEVGGRPAVMFRGRPVALAELAPLLGLGPAQEWDSARCLFVHHGEDRAALAVDGFVGEREVAVKPCGGALLKGAPLIGGAACLEDGRVAVLLHVPDLMRAVRAGGAVRAAERREARLRVLLVDDSPIARATESALVRALGHEVDEAVDGQDALDKLALQAYGAVITDVQMPRVDGIELTRRIRANAATAALPVLLLTSLGSPEDRRRGLDAGASGYLVKGELNADALARALQRLTD